MKYPPILSISRNNTGDAFIAIDEFDENGYGVRSHVLSSANDCIADSVMMNRFNHLCELIPYATAQVDPSFWEHQ